MNSNEFVSLCKDALNYKTLYVMGCFGAPMTATNKKRYSTNCDYNKNRATMINNASTNTFGFDCVCFIKGILWGWKADPSKTYGGATYASNGVPDIGTESMIAKCKEVSTDFSNIAPGEMVWMQGHVGVYVGDGHVVESSPKWGNGVQLTVLGNNPQGATGNSRIWTKHGKLPYIDYVNSQPTTTDTNIEIIIDGKKINCKSVKILIDN